LTLKQYDDSTAKILPIIHRFCWNFVSGKLSQMEGIISKIRKSICFIHSS